MIFYIIDRVYRHAKIFPGGSDGEESACNVGGLGSIPELGRYPGEGKGYPLQYSNQGHKESAQLSNVHLTSLIV